MGEDPSWLPSPPSNRCGSPSKNTTNAAHPLSTENASKLYLFSCYIVFNLRSDSARKALLFQDRKHISSQTHSMLCRPVSKKTTLPDVTASFSEFFCVTALSTEAD